MIFFQQQDCPKYKIYYGSKPRGMVLSSKMGLCNAQIMWRNGQMYNFESRVFQAINWHNRQWRISLSLLYLPGLNTDMDTNKNMREVDGLFAKCINRNNIPAPRTEIVVCKHVISSQTLSAWRQSCECILHFNYCVMASCIITLICSSHVRSVLSEH